jgi:hypothetical protein
MVMGAVIIALPWSPAWRRVVTAISASHVPPRHRGVELGGREGPHRHLELGDHAELRELPQPRPDAALRGAVASERDQDVPADAGADGGDRALDGRHAAGAAHRRRRREAKVGDAEVGDEVLGDDPARRVGDDAVDVPGREPGVGDGRQRGLHLERGHALAGVPAVRRLADAGDGAPVS